MRKAVTAAALAATAWMTAAAALAEPPANLKPAHVAGAGLNVIDLEGQKAWYMAKLGMTGPTPSRRRTDPLANTSWATVAAPPRRSWRS